MKPISQHTPGAEKRLAKAIELSSRATAARRLRGPLYTMVFWPVMDEFQLSTSEYMLADAINKLSTAHAPVPGWCSASKKRLAALTRTSEASLYRALKTLREKGLVEEDQSRSDLLRSSQRWENSVLLCQRKLNS